MNGPQAPLPSEPDTSRLTVSGSAQVLVPADRVRLRFAVETQAPTAEEAAAQNARTMNAVLERVRSEVGPEDRVETSGYGLSPRYRPAPERDQAPEIVGYQARNAVVVVLADVDAAGPVLDAALEAGANRVTELSFFASDTEEARIEADREAGLVDVEDPVRLAFLATTMTAGVLTFKSLTGPTYPLQYSDEELVDDIVDMLQTHFGIPT